MELKNEKFVVGIFFENYLKGHTGVPKVMLAHQQMYQQAEFDYIGLFAAQKSLLGKTIVFRFGMIHNGKFAGIYSGKQLVALFSKWCSHGACLADIHIHHMLYIKQDHLRQLLNAFPEVPVKIYLHDYYNACCNLNLMRNGKEFCGGMGLDPAYCNSCKDYRRSVAKQKQLHQFYESILDRAIFVSPSQATQTIFLRFHPEYENKVIVIAHQAQIGRYQGNLETLPAESPIRVAYLGMPVHHKGWETWKALVNQAPKDAYLFKVYNSSDDTYPGMEKKKVMFSEEKLNAMIEALREDQMQVAILWSICAETYSYTTMEAYAANTFLITNPKSGNIASAVKKFACGLVLESQQELFDLFEQPENVRRLVNAYRERTPGGPDTLEENKEIVALTLANMVPTPKQEKPFPADLISSFMTRLYLRGNPQL